MPTTAGAGGVRPSDSRNAGVGQFFTRARSLYPSRAPGLLLLLLGWVAVWGVLELFVVTSGTHPGRPMWILLHLGYFWGTSYWEAAGLRYSLASVRGRNIPLWKALPGHRTALRFLGLKAVLVPATLAGTLLLILPGSWVAARYGFSAFILVDQDCRTGDALKRSRAGTAGHTGRLMWLSLCILFLNLAGAAVLGLGLLFTLPLSVLAAAGAYETLGNGNRGEL